jgi:hypothetical protein
MCHKSKSELKGTNALRYIEWGEGQGYQCRPTCSSRRKWWDLGTWNYPTLFWSDAYNNRFLVGVNTDDLYGDKRFFFINFKDNYLLSTIYLNSTITPLFIELQGIANLGEGVIYTNVYWLKTYHVLSDFSYTFSKEEKLSYTFRKMSVRNVKSIFEELGFSICHQYSCKHPEHPYEFVDPDKVSFDKVLPDRREIDKIVFEVLGLTEEEQLEVYKAVVELVKNRLVKARSV